MTRRSFIHRKFDAIERLDRQMAALQHKWARLLKHKGKIYNLKGRAR